MERTIFYEQYYERSYSTHIISVFDPEIRNLIQQQVDLLNESWPRTNIAFDGSYFRHRAQRNVFYGFFNNI